VAVASGRGRGVHSTFLYARKTKKVLLKNKLVTKNPEKRKKDSFTGFCENVSRSTIVQLRLFSRKINALCPPPLDKLGTFLYARKTKKVLLKNKLVTKNPEKRKKMVLADAPNVRTFRATERGGCEVIFCRRKTDFLQRSNNYFAFATCILERNVII